MRPKCFQGLPVRHEKAHNRVIRSPAHPVWAKLFIFRLDQWMGIRIWEIPVDLCGIGKPRQLDVDVRQLGRRENLLKTLSRLAPVCLYPSQMMAQNRHRRESLGDTAYRGLMV